MINRANRLKMNTIVGLFGQFVTLVCGFIVPRLILTYYGTEVNGLVSSITHFLSFISLAECGMGVVVQSSLYKPLAEGNYQKISSVIVSSKRFFRKIAAILCVYLIVLVFVYPKIVAESFDVWYTVLLIVAISISTFVQYFICMSYRLLLIADQKGYVQQLFSIITQIINTALCIVIASSGSSIQVLKLCTSIVMLLQPLLLIFYVKKNYKLDKKIKINEEPIKQKWNGIAQHIAYVVLENTPTVVLTLFSTISNVSVYNVYFLVVSGIKGVITSAVSGMQSLLGNMYAKGEMDKLNQAFSIYEWVMHIVVVFLYTCTAVLIVPFVQIYTYGINDAEYLYPVFGILISIAHMLFCIRIPYNAMIFVAGHYKQTQSSAIIEAIINIIVSVALVFSFGLVGVAIGTIVAMSYRIIYLVLYLRKHIMMRPIRLFIKHIITDVLSIALSLYLTSGINMIEVSYFSWAILAIKAAVIVGVIISVLNIAFNFKMFKQILSRLTKNNRI